MNVLTGLDHKQMYIAIWNGNIKSTATLVHIIENNYQIDCVAIIPPAYSFATHKEEHDSMLSYLKRNEIQYIELHAPIMPDRFPRKNKRWLIERFYRKMKCHIVQYVYETEKERKTDLPKAYYITNLYPLVEDDIHENDLVKLIASARLPFTPNQSYSCQHSLN